MSIYQPERTSLNIIGGGVGSPQIVIAPPWQSEEAYLVPFAITAWGNAATNLIYGSIDGVEILQGALSLIQPDHGFVFAINGVGTLSLMPIPMRITERCIILPAPAASGQIFLMYYWERSAVPAVQEGAIALPSVMDRELIETRRTRQENAIWAEERPLNPVELTRQHQEELSPLQKKRRRLLDLALDDQKTHRKKSWLE